MEKILVILKNRSLFMSNAKYPHERAPNHVSEPVSKVSGNEFGGGREDHIEGGSIKDCTIVPAGHTDRRLKPFLAICPYPLLK